jgi:hypothetical protein
MQSCSVFYTNHPNRKMHAYFTLPVLGSDATYGPKQCFGTHINSMQYIAKKIISNRFQGNV